jgi:hypothetical protein
MVKIPGMLIENQDYELIPSSEEDDEHWHIRIKAGEFIESVISFGQIRVDEKKDLMNFDFNLHYTPDDELTVDNLDLQRYAGKVLEAVIVNAINDVENK